jgi:signal transduction histidine kinase
VEYVLAEASRTTSLQYNSVEDVRDTPWLGTCSFLREEGLTCAAIDGWRRARHLREAPPQDDFYYTEGASPHWHIVSDLRTEEQFARRGLVKRSPKPGIRFYAAIPLRGAAGSVLGSLIIVDDVPRYGIGAGELAFMEDVADTITQHLDAVVVRSQRQRSERLIQSLGLFNNGKSSLREWWLRQEDSRYANAGRHAARQTTRERRAAGHAEFGPHASSSSSTGPAGVPHDELASASESDSDDGEGTTDPVTSSAATLQNAVADEVRNHAAGSASRDFGPVTVPPRVSGPKLLLEPPGRPGVRSKRTSRTLEGADFNLETASRRTYGRAANLMRQALGVEGVVFVNANIAHSKKPGAPIPSLKHESSGERPGRFSDNDNDTSDGSASGIEQHCSVEAFSTRDLSSIHQTDNTYRFDLTEKFLALLIRRYPNGRIFNFAPNGSCYSSSGEESMNSGSNSENPVNAANLRVPRDGCRLGRIMPGARTMAFFPIWDETHDRWSSAILVWSTSNLFFFDPSEHILYLAAWSHSISAELGRLQTMASDKAKGSFISSVSHELRSPLHGILAGVEFLEETELNSFQNEMAHTIRMAGRTLLDTVDHILDFAKISSFTRAQTRQRVGADRLQYDENRTNVDSAEIGVTAAVDLALLTEDVIETVVNAHRFQNRRSNVPSVAVDIERRSNWKVEIQPGSWTRILNNLVGNALKYTETGLITIRLETIESAPRSGGLPQVRLSVTDTGIGMTKQFLSRELYTPFKQANSHSTGTGLGLSIVRRICKDSGAALDITSELGVGTRATVDLEARFVADPAAPVPRGLNVERFHWITPEQSAITDPRSIAPSVMTTAKSWLQCATSHGPECEDDSGSVVYAIAEEDLLTWTSSEASRAMASGKSPSHVLVLGQSMRSVSFENQPDELPFIPIFVHQPYVYPSWTSGDITY